MDRHKVKQYLDAVSGKETTMDIRNANGKEYMLYVRLVINLWTNEPFILMPRYRVSVDGETVLDTPSMFDAITEFEKD